MNESCQKPRFLSLNLQALDQAHKPPYAEKQKAAESAEDFAKELQVLNWSVGISMERRVCFNGLNSTKATDVGCVAGIYCRQKILQ